MEPKIQPKQVEFLTLSSPSGHLSIAQGETSAEFNLSPDLTGGKFNFVSNLQKSGKSVHANAGNYGLTGDRSYVLGGQTNYITGDNSLILNAQTTAIYGSSNTIVSANNANILANAQDNTILAG